MTNNFLTMLNDGFSQVGNDYGKEWEETSRLEFLADYVFEFNTYHSGKAALFARKAIEVAMAISERRTFDYIGVSDENYNWYLMMCNMPFFCDRLEWGTSIRGAWWGFPRGSETTEFHSCGLWDGDEQIVDPLQLTVEQWDAFIRAVAEFVSDDGKQL